MKRVLGLLGLCTAGVSAWLFWPAQERPTSPSLPVIVAEPARLIEPARTECRFEQNAQFAYELHAHGTTPVSITPGAAAVEASFDLRSRLEFEVLTAGADQAVLLGKFTSIQQRGSSQKLERPFLIEVGTDCQVLRFARASAAELADARNQQSLLWDGQWRLVSSATPFSAEDGLGIARGEFERQTVDGSLVSTRTLAGYDTLWQGLEPFAAVTGSQRVTVGKGPWFENLENRRDVTSSAGSSSSSTLTLSSVAPAGDVFRADERRTEGYTWEDLLPGIAVEAHAQRPVTHVERRRQEAAYPLTIDQALSNFTALVDQGGPLHERWPDLSAYFEVHPESVAAAVDRLRNDQLGTDEAHVSFYIALGNARVVEARDALLAIKRDQGAPPMHRVRAMFSLLDRSDVGVDFAQELATDSQALSSASTRGDRFLPGESLLALSTMGGLRGEVAIKRVVVETLQRMLSRPLHPSSARLALKAVGNLGDPELIALAEPLTRAERVETRVAAASIFRRMPTRAVLDAEVAWLARESHPFVKAKLYDVIRSQHFDAQVPAEEMLVRQALLDLPKLKSPLARKHVIRMLAASAVANQPNVRAALVVQARWEYVHETGALNEFTSVLTEAEAREVMR